MDDQDKLRRLKRMLGQVAPIPASIESLAARERPRMALESAGRDGTAEHERTALEKLGADREADLTLDETFVLEAIVLPERRPVAFIRNGSYDQNHSPWQHLDKKPVRDRLTPLIRSIGRIEVPNAGIPYGGTGFVVGPDLLMTNRHVARLFADGLGTRITFNAGAALVDFQREVDMPAPDDAALISVERVEMIHPYWDMALLRVAGLEGRFAPLPLSTADPAALDDKDVAVVGYPARDDRNDLAVQDRVFERTYEVKRFQPGQIRGRAQIASFENVVNALTHDSSTLGGNSGSAVIHVQTGRVIGLHFAGVYLKANYAVPTAELARDARIVRLGLAFDDTVAATHDFDAAWARLDGGERARMTPPVISGEGRMSWTIPLRVDVSLGAPASIASASVDLSAPAAVEAMKIPRIYPDLGSRKGFDGDFLDMAKAVPLPKLTTLGKKAVAKLEGGGTELRYHKFSIVMHAKRRLALFTAANVDWRPDHRLIKGKKPTRKQLTGLGPSDVEKWATDDRLAAEFQLPDVFYTKDGGAFDKGHLVRRDDVVWGANFKDMQKANGDTFHTTNCSPQVKSFNQSAQGDDNWGDLESLVQQQTKKEKAILLSGPVLAEDDQSFRGKDVEGGEILLQIPRTFWKIVVVRQGNDAGAYGFLLEQDLSEVELEFAVPEAWRQYLKPISVIEDAIGGLLDLGWFKQRDRFAKEEGIAIRKALEQP